MQKVFDMDNKYIKPIENLSIGKIIEVDGSRIIAELDPSISDLSRVFAGENYPIGQFGSIIKVHFGRRSIYGLVSRLRMKSDYQLEKGLPVASSDERIIEADLFGEGEWHRKGEDEFTLEFERGVATYPLPQPKNKHTVKKLTKFAQRTKFEQRFSCFIYKFFTRSFLHVFFCPNMIFTKKIIMGL